MATILTSSGWMTNFIYEQDLTSYYMNNMLTGILRPGVFNANLAIVIDKNNNNVYLSIKKGTTLLFSNNYKYIENYGIRRNFSSLDSSYNKASKTESDSLVLIKCVAQNDILQQISTVQELVHYPKMFLFATMNYRKKASEADYKVPIFRLAYPNGQTHNSDLVNSTKNFLYKTLKSYFKSGDVRIDRTEEEEEWVIPDGCEEYTFTSDETGISKDRNLENISCLMLGVLASTRSEISNFKYSLSFSGRGLPEYRYQMTSESNDMTPDIVFNHLKVEGEDNLFKSAFIDIPYSLVSNVLINKRIVDTNSKYYDYGWEYPYLSNVTNAVNVDDDSIFTFSDISTTDITSNYCVKIDFVFGCLNNTSVETESLAGLFNTSSSEFKVITDSISEIWTNNYSKLVYSNDSDFWVGDNLVNPYIVPLDISMWNINRLSSLISNSSIWDKVFDKYRCDNVLGESTNYSNKVTDFFPISISFRLVSSSNKENSDVKLPYSEGGLNFENAIDGIYRVNPVNTLSYFDLRSKKCHYNTIDSVYTNMYNQIPIR